MCSICLLTFGATCLFNIIGYYQINKKLDFIKQQQKPPVAVTDEKFENNQWMPKEEYFYKKI